MDNFLNNKDWNIILADKVRCPHDWKWNSDTNNWTGYHLWYVISGEVHIETLGQEISLLTGDVYLFNMNQNHYCIHTPSNPLNVLTVYFRENKSSKNSYDNNIFSRKLVYVNSLFVGKLFSNLVNAFNRNNESNAQLWLNAILTEQMNQLRTNTSNPIEKIVSMINSNPTVNYTLEDLSNECEYSKNHFLRLFKKAIGISPMEYCIKCKINLSKHYLAYSNYTINSISILCGYKDVSHFSKQFKQLVNISPHKYRISLSDYD